MSKFGEAFSAARKAGKKQFTFNGKKYHTRTREEEAARKKKSSSTSNATPKTKPKPPAKPKGGPAAGRRKLLETGKKLLAADKAKKPANRGRGQMGRRAR
jgi:hypothetical protein